MKRLFAAVLAVGFSGFSIPETSAQDAVVAGPPIACGERYTVVLGDTLRDIAIRAYGTGDYPFIFNANRDQLRNPNVVYLGAELLIPCRDGSGPATSQQAEGGPIETAAATAAPAPSAPTAPQGQPFQRQIKFLTGGDYAPFTDEDLRDGGMFTDLVRRSMAKADASRPYRITFVNDWGPHLGILLPEGAFDLGFPWFKPDCTKIDRLSEAMAARCTNFDFSHPFYEVVIGFYVRKGDPAEQARQYSDLFGRTFCRPRGYFTFDLEQEDLRAPNVNLVVPATPSDCFEMLAKGEVDIVSLNVLISEQEIVAQGLLDSVTELSSLAGVQTLHVLSPKTNPFGRTYITLINRGLRELRESGEWFQVVSEHLRDHALRTQ
ncbi:MAG: transporter substrate-binding domain-containing protein [Pseudomonadota bacterium]